MGLRSLAAGAFRKIAGNQRNKEEREERHPVLGIGNSERSRRRQEKEQIYHSDPQRQEISKEELKDTAVRGDLVIDHARKLALAPVRLGVRTVGSVGMIGEIGTRETLEAIGSLIATAIERANAVENLTRTEAARESERLRSALLDSVTHEFRTPLTSIKASATTLLSGA